VGIGIAVGGVLSWMLGQMLRGALAGLSPADPIAFGSAILVLTFTGVAAIYFPARRAARLNPVDALRVE
jgi:ABC-type antimicrobial peptide transport system permease subunit